MKISKDSWHCRVYRRWYTAKYHHAPNDYSNLCPYMRTVLIWAPLRALFGNMFRIRRTALGYFTVPTLLLALPQPLGYLSYGLKEALWMIYFSLALAALAVFICSALFFLENSEFSERVARLSERAQDKIADTSFFSLIHQYLRSAHDRVCPEVSWDREQPRSNAEELYRYSDTI